MTEQELLDILEGVVELATPLNSNGVKIKSLDENLSETGLDSLDMLMVGIYLGDIYGVSEDDLKTLQPVTVRDLFEFMCKHKTKEPTSSSSDAVNAPVEFSTSFLMAVSNASAFQVVGLRKKPMICLGAFFIFLS